MKITPTLSGFLQQEVTDIQINTFFGLGAETSTTYWMLQNEKGEKIADGNVAIPKEVHSKWGTDDTIIENYVLGQLNLTKIK